MTWNISTSGKKVDVMGKLENSLKDEQNAAKKFADTGEGDSQSGIHVEGIEALTDFVKKEINKYGDNPDIGLVATTYGDKGKTISYRLTLDISKDRREIAEEKGALQTEQAQPAGFGASEDDKEEHAGKDKTLEDKEQEFLDSSEAHGFVPTTREEFEANKTKENEDV